VEQLIAHFAQSKVVPDSASEKHVRTTLPAELGALQRQTNSFFMVYPVLFKRSYLNFKRNPNLVLTRIMQVSSFGIILALFFSRLGNDYVAVQNRVGYIQEITPLVFVGMLVFFPRNLTNCRITSLSIPMKEMRSIGNTKIEPMEWNPFSSRTWHWRSLSKSSWALFVLYSWSYLDSLVHSLRSCIDVLDTVGSFFLVMFEVFCFVNCGESLGIMFCTMFNHSGLSVNFTSIVNSLFTSMAGYFPLSPI
jgi:hypothetical protein